MGAFRDVTYIGLAMGLFAAGCGIETPHAHLAEASNADVEAADALFIEKMYENDQGRRMPVRLHVPDAYDAQVKYPLVLYLHGAGARGYDNLDQLLGSNQWGTHVWFEEGHERDNPCFVLAPQCGPNRLWQNFGSDGLSWELHAVVLIIEDLQTKYSIDPDRLYITGYSMGSYGTWDLICKRPNLFAAAVPLAAGGDPGMAAYVIDLPVWAFHGGADPIVSVNTSRDMITAVRQAGGNPRYTEYPDMGHGITRTAYHEPDLLPWLFAQRLSGN